MIRHFHEIIIYTADMPRAIAFWRDTVGLIPVEESTQWSTFRTPESEANSPQLGIMATNDGMAVPFAEPGPNGVQQGAIFSFTVPDLPNAIANLERKGLQFEGKMYDDPAWGRCVAYRDPDRHTFMLVERYAAS